MQTNNENMESSKQTGICAVYKFHRYAYLCKGLLDLIYSNLIWKHQIYGKQKKKKNIYKC